MCQFVQPDVGGFGELVKGTGGGILYEPNTPEALAEALDGLLSDPERARRLGDRGRESVLDRFNVEKTASDMLAIYTDLLRR